jgi:hypothetical protein
MSFLGQTRVNRSVHRSGAATGCVLRGSSGNNWGLRLRVLQEQPRGHDGPLRGPFVILDVGDNKHSQALGGLAGRVTDAAEVLRAIRRLHPGCVSVANTNILSLEPDISPEGDPGDAPEWPGPERREGVVSNPDF